MKPANQTISQRVINDGSIASSQTHSSHSSLESGNSNIIGSIYRIGPKIGAGNFGEIYIGVNILSKVKVAIKRERNRSRSPQLQFESKFYKFLGENQGIPCIYHFETGRRYHSLVMELLGPNLEEIFNNTKRKFNVKTTVLIGMQLIRRIQFVHSKGIIYRDIKPENFLLGAQDSSKDVIHIVDFGLAKDYIDPSTHTHIPFSKNRNLTGTARYMSINTHLGYEQSRRDDLESLGHMLLYFVRGVLPWQGLKAETVKERYVKIGEVKKSIPLNKLCEGLPDEFASYMRYARGLDFFQEPDYDYLYNMFYNFLTTMKIEDKEFEWSLPNFSYTNLLNTFEAEIRASESQIHDNSSQKKEPGKIGDRISKTRSECSKAKHHNADRRQLVQPELNELKTHAVIENTEQKPGIFRCCLPFTKHKEITSSRHLRVRSKPFNESNPM